MLFDSVIQHFQEGSVFDSCFCCEMVKVKHSFCVPVLWTCFSVLLLLIDYLQSMILMSRSIMCRVTGYMYLFLTNYKILTYQEPFNSYFHRIFSAGEKKNNSGWTGSVSSLKYSITIWSDSCGTSDEWEHLSILWSMMRVRHVFWHKIDGTIKSNRSTQDRPMYVGRSEINTFYLFLWKLQWIQKSMITLI